MKKVLFITTQEKKYNATDELIKIRTFLSKTDHNYFDKAFLEKYLRKSPVSDFSFSWYPENAPGYWMSRNILTQSKILAKPADILSVEKELKKGSYSHIVIAIYLSGYIDFVEISKYLRKKWPKIKIIGASVGALLEQSKQFADYTITGNQVDGLRKILDEDSSVPLKPVFIPSSTTTTFKGLVKKNRYALLITSLGCMFGCDFCPSTAQFGKSYSSPFTAKQIKNEIIRAKEAIAPSKKTFTISLADPQGMGDIKLWKEVFKFCKDLPFTCDLITTTSSKIIEKYDLKELTSGALRVTTINIGVESLISGYEKNKNMDLRCLINRIQGAGINVVATYIVGFDWQNQKNVLQEIKLLKKLGSSGHIIANLEMQPGTPIFKQYQKNDRILNIPPELLAFWGYQAFTHPNFKTGFNDMLPLLKKISDYLCRGEEIFSKNLEIFLNRNNPFDKPLQEKIKSELKKTDSDQKRSLLYYKLVFKQIDLFHPYIISTN